MADWLQAPKTAEFPKPGEIKRILASEIPRWSVKSVVDAKNANGVPLRHPWFMEISFDPGLRKWETDYIEIDDERVYASAATIRADRESAAKRAERKKSAKNGRDKSPPKKRAARPPRVRPAKNPARVDTLDEERREAGRWSEINRFAGRGTQTTKPFQITLSGWRFRWLCEGEATIWTRTTGKKTSGG